MFSTKVWCITSLVSSGQRHDGWGFILSLSVYRAKMRKSVVIYTRSYEEPQWSFLLDAVIPSSFPSFASSPSKKSSQLIVHKINWRFKATMQLDFWWMCWCCVTLNVKLFDRLEIFLNSPRFSFFSFCVLLIQPWKSLQLDLKLIWLWFMITKLVDILWWQEVVQVLRAQSRGGGELWRAMSILEIFVRRRGKGWRVRHRLMASRAHN